MNNLRFEFAVDKTTNTVLMTREFAADLSLVWEAFTTQELLDQWWAPKPLLSKTKSMDFKVGGRRFYAMVTTEGQEHYGIQEYTAISPKTHLQWASSFSDKDENINPLLPISNWELNFTEHNGITKVSIAIKHKTLANIEMLIQMGFKEGFTMILNELEELLNHKNN